MIRTQPAEEHGLALDVIQIDGGTQSRATLNQHVVDEYAEALKGGATFPPIVVFYDGKKHWLADGFHRLNAFRQAQRSKIGVDIRQGTRRDAILFSVGANSAHGLQRSDADKRRAIMTLLGDEEWSTWSDREIAKRCKVHHTTVKRVRDDVAAFYRGAARDEGGKYRPGRAAVFDNPAIERAHSGYVASIDPNERTFVHPKTGKPTTMKTAGINAGRSTAVIRENQTTEPATQEAIEDKAFEAGTVEFPAGGDEKQEITIETVAPQGVEGGVEIVVSDVDIIMSVHGAAAMPSVYLGCGAVMEVDTRTDVEREADAIVLAWDKASVPARERFVDYLRFVGFTITESNPATGTGGGDVDRSAERASSAVEVGAPVSPERAHEKVGGVASACSALAAVSEITERRELDVNASESGVTGGKSAAPDEVSADLGRQPIALGAKIAPVSNPALVGSISETPATHPVPNGRQADRAPEVAPPTSGATQFNNPRCLKPETCHFAHSRDCCFDCSMAWAQRPKDEQIRLWAEANEAAA